MLKFRTYSVLVVAAGLLLSSPLWAMHIAEGILPAPWAMLWYALATPFVLLGLRQIRRRSVEQPEYKPLLGLMGAAVFIISCMPVPVPVVGSVSHPCGTGLAAVLLGPGPTVVIATVALLLQALFLAHGGLSTLGGNVLSMGVAGAFVGYGTFWLCRRFGTGLPVAAFFASLFADWATYAMTSLELTLALHGHGSAATFFGGLLLAFAPTQVPLGLLEGLLAAGVFTLFMQRRPDLLRLSMKVAT